MIDNEIKYAMDDLQNSTEKHSIDVVIMVNNIDGKHIIETKLINTKTGITPLAKSIKDIYSKLPKLDTVIFINIYKGEDNKLEHSTVVFKRHGTQMVIASLLDAFTLEGVYTAYYKVVELIVMSEEQYQGPKGRRGHKGVPNFDKNKWQVNSDRIEIVSREMIYSMADMLNYTVIKIQGHFDNNVKVITKRYDATLDGVSECTEFLKDMNPTDIVIVYGNGPKEFTKMIMSEDADLCINNYKYRNELFRALSTDTFVNGHRDIIRDVQLDK